MEIWVVGVVLPFAILLGGVGVSGSSNGPAAPATATTLGFPAIYSFGDDNSDTGEHAMAFADVVLPNGQTFFDRPSGRYCDGRLIIDFIAEHLGMPLLNVYLDSFASNFSHGANFAIGGASITDKGFNLLRLETQIFQFSQFKSRTTALFNELKGENKRLKSTLPRPEDFSRALYIIDIGQNDFNLDFPAGFTMQQAIAAMQSGLTELSRLVAILHDWEGAKFFWIYNVGPLGCLPYNVKTHQKKNATSGLDQNGCVKFQNDLVQHFNKQLKEHVTKSRALYPDATFAYVDVYSAKYNLTSNAKNQGFKDPMKFCCGSYENQYISCGQKENGTVLGSTTCKDPSKFISWDGKHYTEAANKIVAKLIIDGSLSDPPISIARASHSIDGSLPLISVAINV